MTTDGDCRLTCCLVFTQALLLLAFLLQTKPIYAAGAGVLPFTDPDRTWKEVSPDWITQAVRPEPSAPDADLAVTLDQQLYLPLLPLIQKFAAKRQIKILVSEGTCGISAGLLSRKTVDIGGFCCPPGFTDRLPGLHYHTLAVASIALLVHLDNPVENISLDEARRIFSGEVSTWSALGRSHDEDIQYPIHVIGRLHCKLRPGHWRLLLDNEDLFSPDLLEMGTIKDMIRSVTSDPLAIGYETLWMLQHYKGASKAKPLRLDGIRPDDRAALASGRYPLYRVYNVTTWEGPAAKPVARELVQFLQEQMDHLDAIFAMVPASQLRRHGWKFKEDELVDEPG